MELTKDAIEQGGLAGTVRANDAEDLARLHFERDAIHPRDTAEGLAQVGHFQHRAHAPTLSPCNTVAARSRRAERALNARPIRPITPDGQNAISSMTMLA